MTQRGLRHVADSLRFETHVSTDWVDRVSWEERKAYVALTRDEVRSSPEYDAASFAEAEEDALYRHYGRPLEHRRRGALKNNDWTLPI